MTRLSHHQSLWIRPPVQTSTFAIERLDDIVYKLHKSQFIFNTKHQHAFQERDDYRNPQLFR